MGKPKGTMRSGSTAVKRKSVYLHPRKKRKVLTTENKLKVLEMIEKGKSRKEVAQEMEISISQVKNISDAKTLIRNRLSTGDLSPGSKRLMSTKYIEIENAVYKWFCLVRNPHGRFSFPFCNSSSRFA